MNTVFVNPERCIGCRQCEFACAVAHSQSHDAPAALFEDPKPRSRIHVAPGAAFNSSFPVKCRHCDPAPCEGACPTGAIARDPALDLVLIDAHRCISCAMCAMLCPFDALGFHPQLNGGPPRTVAVKCDGCADRLREQQLPACVEACKTGALVFGELNELVAAGRLRQSVAVLSAAAAIQPIAGQVPSNVTAWRNWDQPAASVLEE